MIIRIWNAKKYGKGNVAGDEEMQFESTEAPAPGDLIVIRGREWLIISRIYKPSGFSDTEPLLVDLLANKYKRGLC